MIIIIRLFAHSFVFLICIYIFCFASNLSGSTWWNWLWFIITGLLLLFGFFCHYQENLDSEDEEYKDVQQPLNALLSGLAIVSMSIKVLSQIPDANILILILSFLYIIEIGFRRLSYSSIFGLMSLFLVWPHVDFHIWYEVVGLIIYTLLIVFWGFLSYRNYDCENYPNYIDDEDVVISIIHSALVIIIMVICFVFINSKRPLLQHSSSDGYLYLLYFFIGIIAAIKNNTIAAISIVISGVCYFFFLSSWSTALGWSIDGLNAIGGWISSFLSSMKWIVLAFCVTLGIIVGIIAYPKKKEPGLPPIIYKGKSMTCPYCRKTMVEGKRANKLLKSAVEGGGALAGKAAAAKFGAAVGSAAGPAGTAIGALFGWVAGAITGWVAGEAYDQSSYHLGDGIRLKFKCPMCNKEWEKYEKDGEIVR